MKKILLSILFYSVFISYSQVTTLNGASASGQAVLCFEKADQTGNLLYFQGYTLIAFNLNGFDVYQITVNEVNPVTQTHVRSFVLAGYQVPTQQGGFNIEGRSMVTDLQGNLYLSEENSDRILRYTGP